jgi:hypothetical protein
VEIETGRSANSFGWEQRELLQAQIATKVGLCPRSVSRYLLVLRCPPAVQQALTPVPSPWIWRVGWRIYPATRKRKSPSVLRLAQILRAL